MGKNAGEKQQQKNLFKQDWAQKTIQEATLVNLGRGGTLELGPSRPLFYSLP